MLLVALFAGVIFWNYKYFDELIFKLLVSSLLSFIISVIVLALFNHSVYKPINYEKNEDYKILDNCNELGLKEGYTYMEYYENKWIVPFPISNSKIFCMDNKKK